MAVRVSNGARRANGADGSVGTLGPDAREARLAELMEDREFVLAYCERILGDKAAAEDMVQDTYLQAFRHLDRLEQRESYRPWLATVALHRCRNEIRRRSKVRPTDELLDRELAPECSPEHLVLCEEMLDETIAALEELSPREQDLIRRQTLDDASIVELALADGSTAASVKSVLWRGREKLRDIVGDVGHHALLPVAGLAACVRRQLAHTGARLQQVAPFAGGIERAGEAVVATFVVIALGPAPAAAQDASPEFGRTRFTPAVSVETLGEPTGLEAGERARGPMPAAPSTPTTQPEPGLDAGIEAEPSEPEGDAPALPTPAPSPPDVEPPPAPESPTPRDEADDPEGAFFDDVVWVGDASHPSGGGEHHVFAVGSLGGRCDANCAVLFHSADGGASWEKLPARGIGDAPSDLVVSPVYPHDPRIFVMTPSGLRRSVDGGATFSSVNEPHVGPATMSPAFADGDDRILVGAGPGWTYDASDDLTTPFHPGAFATPNAIHFDFAPELPDTVFAGHFVHGEEGAKWPVVTRCRAGRCDHRTALPRSPQPPEVYVPPGFDETGLVFAWHGGGVLRSADAGVTFEHAELRLPPGVAPQVEAISGDADANLYLAWWDLHEGERFGGVLRSTDGGRTWHPVGQGTALDGGVAEVAVSANGTVLAAPREKPAGGILCSADRGATWLTRCPGE